MSDTTQIGRIDESRKRTARSIAEAVVQRLDPNHRYLPPEAFFPESVGYRSELAATLALAGHMLGEKGWIEAAVGMCDRLLDERVEGMWPIGWWCEFPVYRPVPLEWKKQNSEPNLRYTALTLYSLSIVYSLSGENRFIEVARTAMTSLFERWNPLEETKRMHLSAEAVALAVLGWQHEFGAYLDEKDRIVAWAASTFPEAAPGDFPFFTLIRMMLLIAADGTHHLDTSIRPAIDGLLGNPHWRYEENPKNFRHIEATEDHLNIRGNGAVASIMRIFDLVSGETTFTESELYTHVSSWMDEMIGPNGLSFGCMQHGTRMRYGLGSPPQYMQLWWILGGFMI